MYGYARLTLTRQHHRILALKIAQWPSNAHEITEEKNNKQSTPDRPRFFVFPISDYEAVEKLPMRLQEVLTLQWTSKCSVDFLSSIPLASDVVAGSYLSSIDRQMLCKPLATGSLDSEGTCCWISQHRQFRNRPRLKISLVLLQSATQLERG